MSLIEQKNNLAVIVATFAFTMLGFLAAVITILFSFSRSSTFKKYKRKGHLDVFFFVYYFAIVSLVVTFVLALLTLASGNGLWAMRGGLMSTVNNLAQITLLTVIIVNLSRRAMNEP
ncbi:hypothetical protein [Gallaecimonas mangrovi]|uniref:hypothetical protein n=1 Tax=Gallaecimonas mangrovi TaxID=2291597 RepID=UPI000E1FD6E7|nr:hypothetical protein [Gallaecimonas mangrovi]